MVGGWSDPIALPAAPRALDASAVVYVIWAIRGPESVPIYVGQTAARLVDRIGAHLGVNSMIRGLSAYRGAGWSLYLAYLRVPGAAPEAAKHRDAFGKRYSRLLVDEERRWISALSPRLNQPETWQRSGRRRGGVSC